MQQTLLTLRQTTHWHTADCTGPPTEWRRKSINQVITWSVEVFPSPPSRVGGNRKTVDIIFSIGFSAYMAIYSKNFIKYMVPTEELIRWYVLKSNHKGANYNLRNNFFICPTVHTYYDKYMNLLQNRAGSQPKHYCLHYLPVLFMLSIRL